ncbi:MULTISPECIES: GH1 family beta-glucosidase [unclassified Rathayibacter]|uniref:GH1 family beta-glucosidase n=1 Tax=unclassified Rathayibacter TaxID=2609250 RepID=UPI000F4B48D2|nr:MULTISPECIES: GH1 family beta-glucosidase [unclassified Rathayibacter]ROP49161.1 broad-specificity cellobiase [Rathayibacter sp. PhB186]ROS50722.1 broad-specificity cellobiase [Rathayibacter sp. PhB185]
MATTPPRRSDLPGSFVIGTATASYQVEGATTEDGRGPSIWDTLARRPGAIADGTTGDIADDHYHRVAEDVALMADLGVDAYRFSLAWPRIQPTGSGAVNQKGLDFYRGLAEQLLERGITPWATLYHWDLPQALEDDGGWLERDTAHRFAEYTARTVEALGDVIGDWITLNEPWCSSFLGYASGLHAPGRQEGTRAARAAHHLLLGHGLALPEIRRAAPASHAGITLNLYSIRAASDSPADIDAARRIDGLSNRFFLDPVLQGVYPADVLSDLGEDEWFADNVPASDLELIGAPLDFLGINYYSRHTLRAGTPQPEASAYPGSEAVEFVDTGAARTQMDWEIHPDGLVDVIEAAHNLAPGLPIYITENGSAYADVPARDGSVDDVERTDYLQKHLAACADVIERGLPLQGYFVWSLLDNWEWSWGCSRRFGIVHVDYDTQVRTPKTSARWLADYLGEPLSVGEHRTEEAPA